MFVLCEQRSSVHLYFTETCIFPLPHPPPTTLLSYHFSKKKKTTETSHKKGSEWKHVHVGMEPSNTNQTTWEDTTLLLHHPYTLCLFANYAHHKTLYRDVAYSHSLSQWITIHHKGTHYCSHHSLPQTRQPTCAIFNSNKSSQYNSHFSMSYKLSIAHGFQSFCIQDRPHPSCSIVVKLQPPRTRFVKMHYTPMQHNPLHCLLCTQMTNTRCIWHKM